MFLIQRTVRYLLLFLFLFSLTNCEWGSIGYNKGYAPEQPIAFSHKLHAGDNKMACVYCHTGAERGYNSTVPSLNICMNCHMVVATDKEPIKQLQKKYFDGETVNWVKVHMLPDHVKFNHKRHVQRLSTPEDRFPACQTCHGNVKQMEVIQQNSSLSMGWCVNCHREQEPKAPLNCSTCHN